MHYIFKIGSNTAVYSWIHVECCFVCQGSAAFCLQINFLKSSKKCLTKEENVLVKGGKPSSICCSLYFFWNFIAGISVLTPKGRNHCLKWKYDWFFFLSCCIWFCILHFQVIISTVKIFLTEISCVLRYWQRKYSCKQTKGKWKISCLTKWSENFFFLL